MAANPRSRQARTSLKMSQSLLQFEKCEQRNLLSASPGFEFGATAQSVADEASILKYIAQQPSTAYLQKGYNGLQLVDVESTDVSTTSVFQQTIQGLPVHGAYVTVVQNEAGKFEGVFDRAFEGTLADRVQRPAIGIEIASPIANRGVETKGNWNTEGELVWFTANNQAELAWEIETVVDGANVNNTDLEFVTVVDASDGRILSQVQAPSSVEHLLNNPGQATGVYPRIVINDDIGPQGSRDYAAPFDSVVALTLGCTGTLIAENVVISARHCGAGAGDTIRFGDNSNAPIYTATVQSSILPDGNGSLLDGGDVSILTLTANVPSNIATPMRFIDATEALEGQLAVTAGYGYNGVGSVGHQFSSDGWRWGGENIIDVYGSPANSSGSNIISTDFDNDSGSGNTISGSDPVPLEYEATTAPGDSGGAVFVQGGGGEWLIAGVLSGGTTNTSVYGDISWWTGTAIYRADIEAVGGVFAGGLGTVSLDQSTYFIDDTISVSVVDDNAIAPVSVTFTSDSGDSETVTLVDSGNGVQFDGSIVTSDAAVNSGDGILQATDLDQIMVTYSDPDNGNGGTTDVTDTAQIFAVPGESLIGVDFDQSGSNAPNNWGSQNGGSNTTIQNLVDEFGVPTTIDLAIAELTDGSWSDFAVTPAANTIPQHSNALANVDGQIYSGADPIRLTYSDLEPGSNYEVYVMAAEGFYESIQQDVTITGEGTPISFSQNFESDVLFVNDQIGDSTRQLSEYAQVVTANASGEIVIDITPVGNTQDVVLAGVAIKKAPDIVVADARKFLIGSVTSGSLTDTVDSDDVYYDLAPTATTNLNKQRIDLILLGEYDDTTADTLSFQVEAQMSGGTEGDVVQEIRLFDQTIDQWVLIDTRIATNADSVVDVSPTEAAGNYIDPITGEVLARVIWSSPEFASAPFAWSIAVDQLRWAMT